MPAGEPWPARRCSTAVGWQAPRAWLSGGSSSDADEPRARSPRAHGMDQPKRSLRAAGREGQAHGHGYASAGTSSDSSAGEHSRAAGQSSAGAGVPHQTACSADELDGEARRCVSLPGVGLPAVGAAAPAQSGRSAQQPADTGAPVRSPHAAGAGCGAAAPTHTATEPGAAGGLCSPSPDPAAAAGVLDARVDELRKRLERAEAAAAAVTHAADLRGELCELQAAQHALQVRRCNGRSLMLHCTLCRAGVLRCQVRALIVCEHLDQVRHVHAKPM